MTPPTRWGDSLFSPPMISEALARVVVAKRAGAVIGNDGTILSPGRCEVCGLHPSTDWHHRLARSHGGPWAPSNGLHLCHDCHMRIHHHPADSALGGWVVRAGDPMSYDDLPVWLRIPWSTWGAWWLINDDGDYVPFDRADVPPWLPRRADARHHREPYRKGNR